MKVSVVYAQSHMQTTVELCVESSATIANVLELASVRDALPGVDVDGSPVGVFGHECPRTTKLSPGDRIEIYRPLLRDPKDQRRERAKKESNSKT